MSRRLVDVRPGEGRALALSFVYFFALLSGYYVLRPLREEMGIAGGAEKLPWLFTATFVVMLAAVPAFSAAAARLPRARLIPIVYRFFGLHLVTFFLVLRFGADRAVVARVFFVWTSVFNLFVVSVFWSFMADVWTRAEGERLFGFISAGGSAGALAGPALTGALVTRLGPTNLLLVAAALLEVATLCASRLGRASGARGDAGAAPVGGTALSGVAAVFASPYMRALGLQTLLHTTTATWVYLEQARLVGAAMRDPTARTRLFAEIDLVVNVLSLGFQVVAGRVIAGLGLAAALAVLPVMSVAGFAALAVAPSLSLVLGYQVLRRALHYGIDRPAREVLFTVVPREQKYKSKSFLDTVVYRAGDAASGWLHTALGALGAGVSGAALAALPLSLVMLAVNLWLARRATALPGAQASPPVPGR